ncbi:thioester reductase domain-containing protein [Thecamonas trahens ATCC 50062]|uniref:Thioester reductase domain-containing protein n=1 Tax=Thecamonas trahens ATCC 50062 TaxID=461836 RepID=A0A0L0DUH2_THETB|nr:thioester reductase domain-containing protein [Thecamonas trahens ATCC 50062]KNC55984.1 thioester reductase domain-containing protein [Thecamonas trahens ATCC 50062]|eukprot:XP_013761030.1 thioester reductase domain-containing protein [Thecamonas trahens ATCC 50062]
MTSPPHVSGVWTGTAMAKSGEVDHELTWVLTLAPRPRFPSAFGAALGPDDSGAGSSDGAGEVEVLMGSVARRFVDVSSPTRRYGATYSVDGDGLVWLKGVWRPVDGDDGGPFAACCTRGEGAETEFLAGLWIGEAVPHPELAPFFIPTNPVMWSMAVDKRAGRVFGAGFFEDSGDVPGSPVLTFTLAGRVDAASGAVTVVKHYDASHEATHGYDVEYTGAIEAGPDGLSRFTGSWRNVKGGSYGEATAVLQPSTSIATHICLCSICSKPVFPGETRWSCEACEASSPWYCCGACHVSDMAEAHEHYSELAPRTTCELNTATGASCGPLIADAFRRFADRPFIGQVTPDGSGVTIQSYAEVAAASWAYAAYFRAMLEQEKFDGKEPPRILLACDVSPAYVPLTLGVVLSGAVLVPVHAALAGETLSELAALIQPAAVVVDGQVASKTQATMSCLVWEMGELAKAAKAEWEAGSEFEPVVRGDDEVTAVLFTSGSTGTPKGSMFTESLMRPSAGNTVVVPLVRFDFQSFDPTFVLSLLSTMRLGQVRIFASSMANMRRDLEIARPTNLGAAPSFWASLYNEYRAKTVELMADGVLGRAEAAAAAGAAVKASLGNRLMVATSGGAPLSEQVAEFAKQVLGIDLVNLYGSRETGGIARDGVVYPGIEVHLEPLAEELLGDVAAGSVSVGEIYVHSPRLIPGYWGNAEATAERFVDLHGDGRLFYKTGDIGETFVDSESGRISVRIVDRVASCIKLVSGEWIAPAAIESALEASPAIESTLVMAEPRQRSPVVVVVPTEAGRKLDASEMLTEVRFWARQAKLRPLEIPQAVFVEPVAWTVQCGGLTPTGKKRRAVLGKRYRAIRDELYRSGSASSSAGSNDQVTVLAGMLREAVDRALPGALPESGEVGNEVTLADLGGDSLAAAVIVNTVAGAAGEGALSMATLYEYPLVHVAAQLEAGVSGTSSKDAVAWERAVNAQMAALAPVLKAGPESRCGNWVVVSGSTGFLGPYLVAALAAAHPSADRVVCLVRGEDDAGATARFRAVYAAAIGAEPEPRVVVRAADLEAEKLGLSADVYAEIVGGVGLVVHSGARVNLSLPYAGLEAANVSGTRRMLELALLGGAAFRFVSTVGAVTATATASETNDEDWNAWAPHLLARKSGYGQSKAVAEEVVRRAGAACARLQVRVFRPTAISGAADGASNAADFTSLLIKLIAEIGGAPEKATMPLRWAPVEWVARAVAEDDRQEVANLFGAGPTLGKVVAVMRAEGIDVDELPLEAWKERAEALVSKQQHPLYPLADVVRRMDPQSGGSVLPRGAALPVVSDAYVAACVRGILGLGTAVAEQRA